MSVGFLTKAESASGGGGSPVKSRAARLASVAAAAAGSRKRGWRQYYLATPSDVAVDAYQRWLAMAGAL